MNCKKTILAVIALSLLAGLGLGLRLMATDPPEDPLYFNGYFHTLVHHDMKLWEFGVKVLTPQNKYVFGVVTFIGRPVKKVQAESSYLIRQEGYEPPAGAPIIMTFQSNAVGSPLYTARVEAYPPIRFSSPARNAHIRSLRGTIFVSWSGGNPPYRIFINKGNGIPQPGSYVGPGFDEVTATSMYMSLDKCIAGNDYTITVGSKIKIFTFDRPVNPNSHMNMYQSASITFHLD